MLRVVGLESFLHDARLAARRCFQHPRLTVPVTVALALGIGATTAVFSAVDAAVLRPLPFRAPDELVTLTGVIVPSVRPSIGGRSLDLNEIRTMRRVFATAAGFASGELNLSDPDNPMRVRVGVVTTHFFETLGIAPEKGRTFSAIEGVPNGPAVAILSDEFTRHFGDRDMLGATVSLNRKPYYVIGIMPPGFSFPNESDLWIPMTVPTTAVTLEPFRGFLLPRVVGRLAPGVTAAFAEKELRARWRRLSDDAGRNLDARVGAIVEKGAVVGLQRELVGDRTRPLTILLSASMLLLLIACGNVANLLLSEAAVRRQEFALRLALGATRWRIVRQLLIESILLSLFASVIGVILAPALLHVLGTVLPRDLAGVAAVEINLRVLVFATSLTLMTAVGFGLWPALRLTRQKHAEEIGLVAKYGVTVRRNVTASTLLVCEVALTLMLGIGAGLTLRSLERLMTKELGMKTEGIATLELAFVRGQSNAERRRVIQAVIGHLGEQHGIEGVGAVSDLPLRAGNTVTLRVEIDGAPPPRDGDERSARLLTVTGSYFNALGIALLRGRTFTVLDDSLQPRVAIINSSAASKWWPGVDPIGRTFRRPGDSLPITIVGLVADVRERHVDRNALPQVYLPIDLQTPLNVAFVARGSLSTAMVGARLIEAVKTADPSQPVFNVRTMEAIVAASVAPRRTIALLIGIFATLGLILATFGVYAVIAYSVTQRSREFGIRGALGATSGDMVTLVVRGMTTVILVGMVAGLIAAWWLSQVLATFLYDLDVHDPTTFVAVPLFLLAPLVLATIVPATRITRLSPAAVMRLEC